MQGRNTVAGRSWAPVVCALALAAIASAQTIRYRAELVTSPPGFNGRAMNASRTLAGFIPQNILDSGGATVSNGVMTPLEDLPGMSTSLVSIADSGVAFGRMQPEWSPPEESRSFTSIGAVIDPLPTPPPEEWWREWRYSSMNNHGQFAGTVRDGSQFRAARWDSRSSDPVLLGDPARPSGALALNDRGDVVVSENGPRRWSVWSPDGAVRELEPLAGLFLGEFSMFINDSGEVAAINAGRNKVLHWNEVGELTVIVEDQQEVPFAGIDPAGRVIWTDLDPASGDYVPRLWEDGERFDLTDLVDDFDGEVFWTGFLNSRGEIFVYTSQGYAVLVPVPSPGSVGCLLALGGAALVRRRRAGS
jgi:hypothetical protein